MKRKVIGVRGWMSYVGLIVFSLMKKDLEMGRMGQRLMNGMRASHHKAISKYLEEYGIT